MWIVYLLQSCVNGRLYTGITLDMERRLERHNAGKGAKSTRAGRPYEVRYFEEWGTKGEALRRETAIKRLSRAARLALRRA